MKPITFTRFFGIALALTIVATGCKKGPLHPTEIPGGSRTTGKVAAPPSDVPPPSNPIRTGGDAQPTPFGNDATGRNAGPGTGTGTDNTGARPPVISKDGDIPMAGPEDFAHMKEIPEILKEQSVYFDYDSSAVKGSEKAKLGPVADYLKGHESHKVRIYGNCDERGTEEYNRALGERRALALRLELVGLGVDPVRIDTVTNGKDKPIATGHDESAWRQNRRGDFVVLVPNAAP